METVIVWFRRDLRLEDNPAWKRALDSGHAVIPVYLHDPEEGGIWASGAASNWWLHHALVDLSKQLDAVGSRLILRNGAQADALEHLIDQTGAGGVYWNRCYEPWRIREDSRMKSDLSARGLDVWSGNSSLLREPWEVSNQQGNAYKVFTPFSKAFRANPERSLVEIPDSRPKAPRQWPDSVPVDELRLLPDIPWDKGFYKAWKPTRQGGLERLDAFLDEDLTSYKKDRDFPGIDGTSRLSPYLHFGQMGPREIAARIRALSDSAGRETFHRELLWREFAYHVLYHFPDTPDQPLQPAFKEFPWRSNADELKRWQMGQTGYPIVDAGMRELWQTGWMHNRVRMIVASLLVKHLLHSWTEGARWFWDTLVDADLASNTLGWQWAGGCGADAAPYFRIFNPIIQGKKFDPDGTYIRRFVPELNKVPQSKLHTPWEMSAGEQAAADCRIGEDYPAPVVEHSHGRERALEALESTKKDN